MCEGVRIINKFQIGILENYIYFSTIKCVKVILYIEQKTCNAIICWG